MYTFLKIFTVVMLALALFNWLADRDRRADTNIPNATPGLSILTAHTKYESRTDMSRPFFFQVTSNTRARTEMSVSISLS